jgi:hypothetical protein
MTDRERFDMVAARFDILADPRTSPDHVSNILEGYLFSKGRAATMDLLAEFISDHRLDQFSTMKAAAE